MDTEVECSYCHSTCLPHYKFSHNTFVLRCRDCYRFVCDLCHEQQLMKRSPCTTTNKPCQIGKSHGEVCVALYCRIILYLLDFENPCEQKQLVFDKWSPLWCEKCRVPITPTKRLHRIIGREVLCVDCRPNAAEIPINDQTIAEEYMESIAELKRSFSRNSTKICKPFIRKPFELRSALCAGCKISKEVMCFTEEGRPLCERCAGKEKTFHLWKTEGGRIFYDLVAYIPDMNDLKLLTYSTWTPLKCEICKIPFSEGAVNLPFFHPDCHKLLCQRCSLKHKCSDRQKPLMVYMKFLVHWIREFRALFKNGGRDIETPVPAEQPPVVDRTPNIQPRSAPTSSRSPPVSVSQSEENYNADIILRGGLFSNMSDSAKCLECNRVEEIDELSSCDTCNVHGLCARCLKKRHWGHDVYDVSDKLRAVLVQHNQVNTVEKLIRWKENIDDVTNKRIVMQKKLIDAYRQLHTNALQTCDTELVHSMLSLANINQLQNGVMNFITSNIRFNSEMEVLYEKVTALASDLPNK